jgi:hypothetical protein
MSDPRNTYCICPKCKQRDRRKLPALCRTCSIPLVDSASAEGKAVAPKLTRGFQIKAGRREKHTATGDATNATPIYRR